MTVAYILYCDKEGNVERAEDSGGVDIEPQPNDPSGTNAGAYIIGPVSMISDGSQNPNCWIKNSNNEWIRIC